MLTDRHERLPVSPFAIFLLILAATILGMFLGILHAGGAL